MIIIIIIIIIIINIIINFIIINIIIIISIKIFDSCRTTCRLFVLELWSRAPATERHTTDNIISFVDREAIT